MQTFRRSEQILHHLGQKIVEGELPPSTMLPKVEVFGELHGVSRTVVREALKGLEARGMVASTPKVGTRVQPRSEWQWWNRDVLTWALNAPDGRDYFRQLTEVRLALEPMAVSLAAQNATIDDIDHMKSTFERMKRRLGDDAAWAEADYEFHQALLTGAHNELMASLMMAFRSALIQSRTTSITLLKEEEGTSPAAASNRVLEYHEAILNAVIAHDPSGAQRAMTDLLRAVEHLIQAERNE